MQRTLFEPEHDAFRDMVRTFMERSVAARPRASGRRPASSTATSGSRPASRGCSAWTCRRSTAAAASPTSATTPCWTRRSPASARPASASGCTTTSSAPYLLSLTTEEQKRRWLPGFCSGELITAIAMTEPGAGSDLQRHHDARAAGTATTGCSTARRRSSPTGSTPTWSIVAAQTDPDAAAPTGSACSSVERGMPGFERGRNLDKIGMKAQDTAELFFDDVRVPAANLLGEREPRLRPPDGRTCPRSGCRSPSVAVAACEACSS